MPTTLDMDGCSCCGLCIRSGSAPLGDQPPSDVVRPADPSKARGTAQNTARTPARARVRSQARSPAAPAVTTTPATNVNSFDLDNLTQDSDDDRFVAQHAAPARGQTLASAPAPTQVARHATPDPASALEVTASTSTSANCLGLNCLTPGLDDGQLDIVAIHGINGHAHKTFLHKGGALWLRDFLPEQIPGARVFSFGYDAQVAFTTSKANLDDFARSLLTQLKMLRSRKEQQSRPLIFICHSMGGIVVKQALLDSTVEGLYTNCSRLLLLPDLMQTISHSSGILLRGSYF
jgi:hypothetical protein